MKYGLNGTIPALVNSSVGSPWGTSDALGMGVWPFETMKSMNVRRISSEFMCGILEGGRETWEVGSEILATRPRPGPGCGSAYALPVE